MVLAILYTSLFSILLPIAFWVYRNSNLKSRLFNLLGIVLALSGLSDGVSYVLAKSGYPNAIVTNTYFILQFIVLSVLYASLLPSKKSIMYAGIVLFLLYCIIITQFYQGLQEFQSLIRVAGGLILVLYSIWYYIYLNNLYIQSLAAYSPFWINTAICVYFTCVLYFFAKSTTVFATATPRDAMLFWSFHNVNNILKNVLFTIAIYQGKASIDILSGNQLGIGLKVRA